MAGTWSENWAGTHAEYVRKNAGVKSVMEHRNVEGGEIYCVSLDNGGFEVRRYVGEKLSKKSPFPSGLKAVLAYRALRDELVPNRTKVVAKATKKEAKVAKPKVEKPKVEKKVATTKMPKAKK
jgi:hypothetical protein